MGNLLPETQVDFCDDATKQAPTHQFLLVAVHFDSLTVILYHLVFLNSKCGPLGKAFHFLLPFLRLKLLPLLDSSSLLVIIGHTGVNVLVKADLIPVLRILLIVLDESLLLKRRCLQVRHIWQGRFNSYFYVFSH